MVLLELSGSVLAQADQDELDVDDLSNAERLQILVREAKRDGFLNVTGFRPLFVSQLRCS